jgi:WD40 repeat protein
MRRRSILLGASLAAAATATLLMLATFHMRSERPFGRFYMTDREPVVGIGMSQDGNFLAANGAYGTTSWFAFPTGSPIMSRADGGIGENRPLEFSPDAACLLTRRGKHDVAAFDRQGNPLFSFTDKDGLVKSLSISRDGAKIYIGADSKGPCVTCWDYVTRSQQFHIDLGVLAGPTPSGMAGELADAKLSPSGTDLAAAISGAVLVISTSDGALRKLLRLPSSPIRIAYANDGHYLATVMSNSRLLVWDTSDYRTIFEAACLEGGVWPSIAFLSDSKHLLTTGARYISGPGAISVWNIESNKEVKRIRTTGRTITAIIVPRDGNTLVTSSLEGAIELWDVNQLLRK